eukprot:10781122-Alexandrium_andersonii.AAC.2
MQRPGLCNLQMHRLLCGLSLAGRTAGVGQTRRRWRAVAEPARNVALVLPLCPSPAGAALASSQGQPLSTDDAFAVMCGKDRRALA